MSFALEGSRVIGFACRGRSPFSEKVHESRKGCSDHRTHANSAKFWSVQTKFLNEPVPRRKHPSLTFCDCPQYIPSK
jgi:hypothetical protein